MSQFVRESLGLDIAGSSMFSCVRKLSSMQGKIKKWVLNKKKQWGLNWDAFSDELNNIQQGWNRGCKADSVARESSRCSELKEFAHNQWLYWRQRSKQRRDTMGDCHSRYFS